MEFKIKTTILISTKEKILYSLSFESLPETREYSLDSAFGSFVIKDRAKKIDNGVLIHRNIIPTSQFNYGYKVETNIETVFDFKEAQFFLPGAWYGNDELRFSKNTKYPLNIDRASGPIDTMNVPVISIFQNTNYLKFADVSFAKCETITEDFGTFEDNILIDEHINIPGLGVKDINGKVCLIHEYPSDSYRIRDEKITIRRFAPLNKEISISFEIKNGTASSFEECMRNTFREEFDRRYKIDENVNENDVLRKLINYVAKSYKVIDGIPHLMAYTQHFVNESGFLYRNTDLAYLLLKYHFDGYKVPISVNKLIKVIDSQVSLRRCAENQFFDFIRSRIEGVEAVFDAYCLLKEQGIEKTQWLDLVLKETEYYKDLDEYFSISLFLKLARYGINKESYTDIAMAKGDKLYRDKVSKYFFVGAIVDFTIVSLDKETGVLGLQNFVELFKETGEKKYLEYAKICADYAETYQILQDFSFEAFGEKGNRSCNILSVGNDHINLRGMSYVSSTSSACDHINVLLISYLYELGKLLNDDHYHKMAIYIERNAITLINRNDKACMLDDPMFNTKDGYVVEFYQTGASCDYGCSGKGYGQDSALAWVYYVYLFNCLRLKKLTGHYFLYKSNGYRSYYCNQASKANVYINDKPTSLLTDRNYDIYVKIKNNDLIKLLWKKYVKNPFLVLSFENQFMEYSFEINYYLNGKNVRKSTVEKYIGRAYTEQGCAADEMTIRFKNTNPFSYLAQIQVFGKGINAFKKKIRPQCSNDNCFGLDKSMRLECENRTFKFDSKNIGLLDQPSNTFFTKCNVLHLHEKKVSFHMKAKHDGNLMIHVRDFPYYNPNNGLTNIDVFIDNKLISQLKVEPSNKIGEYLESPIKKGGELRLDFLNVASKYQVIEFVVNNT